MPGLCVVRFVQGIGWDEAWIAHIQFRYPPDLNDYIDCVSWLEKVSQHS
jgi:hypothetical protein